MEKQYSTFSVKSNIPAITMSNYPKYTIEVHENGHRILDMTPWYLSLDMYTDIFSGNEEAAKKAINDYIYYLKRAASRLENLMAK